MTSVAPTQVNNITIIFITAIATLISHIAAVTVGNALPRLTHEVMASAWG